MTSTEPMVSVIVVSYNRADDLRRCLTSIFDTGYPRLEVIVVDNASGDDAPDVAASFEGIRLIRNTSNAGFSGANNQGLASARGDYVALINNDAVVAPDYFGMTVDFMESHPECAAAGGKAYLWDDDHAPGDRTNPYYSYSLVNADNGRVRVFSDTPDRIREVATLSGCAVVIRRKAIDGIAGGLFHPLFFTYYEETDFFARAIRSGWKLYYLGDPAVWHRVRGGDASASYNYHYHMERNRLLYAWRNFSPAELAVLKRSLGRKARTAGLKSLFRLLRPERIAKSARRDALLWCAGNPALMDEHRMSLSALPWTYNDTVREMQAREGYHHHQRPDVLEMIPAEASRIIDVGCGGGGLGAVLKRARPGIQVRGIEIVPEQAEAARRVLDDAHAGRAEEPRPAHWPKPDCVVFADVLEHLADPWKTLRYWAAELETGGSVVVSVPNVAHSSVLLALSSGRWDYTDVGIMDRTHLRFFTRDSLTRMLTDAGLRPVSRRRILELPPRMPFRHLLRSWARRAARREPPAGSSGLRRFLLDAFTVQYVVLAMREGDPDLPLH